MLEVTKPPPSKTVCSCNPQAEEHLAALPPQRQQLAELDAALQETQTALSVREAALGPREAAAAENEARAAEAEAGEAALAEARRQLAAHEAALREQQV